MKVTTKFFVVALILSLIFAVSAVAAAEDISFDQSDSEEVLQETDMELDQGQDNIDDKLSVSEADDDLNSPTEEENQLSSGSNTVTGENFTDIQTVIDSAQAGETIFLDGKTYRGSSEITVDKGLIIDGGSDSNGCLIATLDAQELSRILYVTASNVVIKNINFINGKTSSGGAIYCSGANGIIENCNFTNNKATGDYSYGGAVYFRNTGNVTNCNFTDNTASSQGGAVYFYEQGTVTNCNFTGNTATKDGGAVYFSNKGTVTNCNFTGNNATRDGGAVYFESTGNVTNCNFTNNSARCGGAVYFSGTGEVTNCNFTNNKATGDNAPGGAIFFLNTGTVTNCNFTDNIAPIGGAINMGGGTVSNCNFINNTATSTGNDDGGGAVRFQGTGNVTNCNFTDNTANRYGGAVYFYQGTGTVSNCNFTNNTALQRGGAVYFRDSGTVSNCNFTDNGAYYGGAVLFYKNGEVTNCNFTDNSANYDGGAIRFGGSGTVSNCNFTNNSATSNGGAVYFNINGEVTNCNFTNNTANYGGSVYFKNQGNVSNCNFTNNKATGDYARGGAIFFVNTGDVTNCNFTGNTANYDGGAIRFSGSGTVTNCNFTDNSADFGGAINIYSGTVSNCNFTNNTASRSNGGAINMGSGNVTNCNFTGNTADNGGAVYFQSTGTVANCNFTGNNATSGSAIYFYSTSATRTVFNSTFLNNRANAGALDIVKTENNITITFPGQNNLLNAIYSPDKVTFTNVTYWGAKGITTVSDTMSGSNKAAGQNITVGVVVNDRLVLSGVKVTDDNGMIVLPIIAGENYYISARHDTDSYYTEAERTISNNTKFNVNVTSQTTNNRTVNITAKSNIPNDVVKGKLLFIVPNTDPITATYAGNGTWWAVHTFEEYVVYEVNATYSGLDNVTINNATITINKANSTLTVGDIVFDYGGSGSVNVSFTGATGINASVVGQPNAKVSVNGSVITVSGLNVGTYTLTVTTIADGDHNNVTNTSTIIVNRIKTELSANDITSTYNTNMDLVITLKDGQGKALSGFKVTVDLNGVKEYVSDANGQVKVSTKGLAPKTYTAKITFNGDDIYDKSSKEVKVTVKKATPKIIAKKKTFKAKATKKFTITLKDNTGKPIKNAKVRLIVKKIVKKTKKTTKKTKKKYKKNIKKTNKKGKATFKVKRNKKGKYQAIIKYYGNNNYKAITKKVKITIK